MKKLFSLGSLIDAGSGLPLREEFHRAPANRKPRRPFNGGLSLILFGLATLPLFAQPGPVSVRPDCFQFFTFTAPANGLTFDNRSAGCPYFAIAYSSNGFSVESLVVQVAPDAGGTPGTWATYTANSGINPNTAITQAFSTFTGYFPWVRVQLTSVTGSGSIQGVLYGWRTPADIIAGGGSSGGCPGTVGTPCVVVGPTAVGGPVTASPVPIGGQDINSGEVTQIQTDSFGQLLLGNSGDPPQSDATTNALLNMMGSPLGPGFNLSLQTVPFLFNGATWDRARGSAAHGALVQPTGNDAVLSGQQAVTNAAVALGTNGSKNICVKALAGNTANVYIGPTGITTATGMELAAGDAYCGPVSNTNLIFVIATAGGQSVSWIATN